MIDEVDQFSGTANVCEKTEGRLKVSKQGRLYDLCMLVCPLYPSDPG